MANFIFTPVKNAAWSPTDTLRVWGGVAFSVMFVSSPPDPSWNFLEDIPLADRVNGTEGFGSLPNAPADGLFTFADTEIELPASGDDAVGVVVYRRVVGAGGVDESQSALFAYFDTGVEDQNGNPLLPLTPSGQTVLVRFPNGAIQL